MNAIKNAVMKFVRDEEGVSAIEYGILAVIIVGVVAALEPTITAVFTAVFAKVTAAVAAL